MAIGSPVVPENGAMPTEITLNYNDFVTLLASNVPINTPIIENIIDKQFTWWEAPIVLATVARKQHDMKVEAFAKVETFIKTVKREIAKELTATKAKGYELLTADQTGAVAGGAPQGQLHQSLVGAGVQARVATLEKAMAKIKACKRRVRLEDLNKAEKVLVEAQRIRSSVLEG